MTTAGGSQGGKAEAARRYRRPGTLILGLVLFSALLMFALVAVWEIGGTARAKEPLLDRVSMWIGLGPILWFMAQVLRSHVATNAAGITVLNPATRTFAPWSAVASIGTEPLTVTLVDGRVVKPFAFSASELADLTGDKWQRKAESEIGSQFRANSTLYDPLSKYERRIDIGLIPFALATLGWFVLAYIAYQVHL